MSSFLSLGSRMTSSCSLKPRVHTRTGNSEMVTEASSLTFAIPEQLNLLSPAGLISPCKQSTV